MEDHFGLKEGLNDFNYLQDEGIPVVFPFPRSLANMFHHGPYGWVQETLYGQIAASRARLVVKTKRHDGTISWCPSSACSLRSMWVSICQCAQASLGKRVDHVKFIVGTLSNMSEREDHRLGQDLEVELPRSCPQLCEETRIDIHLGDTGIDAENDGFESHATHLRT